MNQPENTIANVIVKTSAEIQSGQDRQKWAEGLITQLPSYHNGRNSWLLNYGVSQEAKELRTSHPNKPKWNEKYQAVDTTNDQEVIKQTSQFGNTIPFSLEKWQAGYEAVCRDGTMPSELHYLPTAIEHSRIVIVIGGLLTRLYEHGGFYADKAVHSQDLFLRPKMEKWYRRAYWIDTNLIYATPAQGANDPGLRDDRFAVSTRKWAGPIEEFEVMAREG